MIEAVFIGLLVLLAGTLPRNLFFAANLRLYPGLPWAVPLTAAYLWYLWRYLHGAGPPESTSDTRRALLRANRVAGSVWRWSLLAGGLGIVALVLGLRVANRFVNLPSQDLPEFANVPVLTVLALLLAAAPLAGIVEESAFRGYMQGPIERRYGLPAAILITGTMFALSHLDFTLVLWPYYLAVSAIYGTVTYHARSILPAVVLHTAGNTYSNLDLWLHGQAEWQAGSGPGPLIWDGGPDAAFWRLSIALVIVAGGTAYAYVKLARVAQASRGVAVDAAPTNTQRT